MMSPNYIPEDRASSHTNLRHAPLQIIHVIGSFLRIWSVYSMYNYLSHTGASVVLFIFSCLVPSSVVFLVLQRPWKGRPLANTQVVPSVINGALTALYFILWGIGLKSCGPVRAVLAEYSGAVLGVVSAVLYGRRGNIWKKVNVPCTCLISYVGVLPLSGTLGIQKYDILFKQYICNGGGWTCCNIPLNDRPDSEDRTEETLNMKSMVAPIFAGILSALRRVIARRVSLKNQLKRRLHAITIASATCFLFPVAMWDMIVGSTNVELPFSAWAFSSTILFGVILIFYVDSIAEERLHMVFSSPRHLMVAGGCLIVMEIFYKMDFSLPGFGYTKQRLWNVGKEITSKMLTSQMGFLKIQFRCLLFQLEHPYRLSISEELLWMQYLPKRSTIDFFNLQYLTIDAQSPSQNLKPVE
ncbi:hypothetical protein Ccrd_018887 [Cynara cardunculus var. scolymus]|uniref:Uncharacterized protein n=1 Tax=Cynara cardunculus var. scolymus TaxID=59895 RepID=A0A124SFD0_CYNCS|nr:hypothetical protein Ccrd_018887 [Cynara cardunculus var. scolymus]